MVISKWKRLNAVAKDHGTLKMGSFHPICRVTQISERLDHGTMTMGYFHPICRVTQISERLSHVYWITPIRIRTGEIIQSVNPLSWIPANVRPMHAHAFLLSLPFNQDLTQSFITFPTISDEFPRRRRIRPLIPVIFLQLILYQRLAHLVVGSLVPSSLHSPRGRSQCYGYIRTRTYVLYISISMIIYPLQHIHLQLYLPNSPLPPLNKTKRKSKAELEAARDLTIFLILWSVLS